MPLAPLPPSVDLETKSILKKLAEAHRYLAELKGTVQTIPNEEILINILGLQEAKASSEIENIVTTQDDLFQAHITREADKVDPAAKEVEQYAQALKEGFAELRKTGVLSCPLILGLQETIEKNRAGYRKQLGTTLTNQQTGQVVYTPPGPEEIIRLMAELQDFINDSDASDLDPLVKLALIHFQFERIHPFYDGNGRTGRIINVLYLMLQGLLNLPVLYLSRYIILHKQEYYELIRAVGDRAAWEDWIVFILDAVSITSRQTLITIQQINKLIFDTRERMREELPRIADVDGVLENLFRHPYTTIQSMENNLGKSRPTVSKYLKDLTEHGFLDKRKKRKGYYYVNEPLVECLTTVPDVS